jgi:hypothetical protein
VGDAFQYLLLGGGEHRRMTRSTSPQFARSIGLTANADFDVFAS